MRTEPHGAARGRCTPTRPARGSRGGGEAARANATARALGTLAALMLSPVAGRHGGEGQAVR